MSRNVQRQYPNLEHCHVILQSSTGGRNPPVADLPPDILHAARETTNDLPDEPYDFALEREVIRLCEERQEQVKELRSSGRECIKREVITRMKSVTNAGEEVCVDILETNGYDLKTSIETFYQSLSDR